MRSASWRHRRRVAIAASLMACCAIACHESNGSRSSASAAGGDASIDAFRPLAVGDTVPPYAVVSLMGDTIRVVPGSPVTVLNVWATWCTSCREEMADLAALHREMGPRGVRVVGVSVDLGDVERVQRFVAGEKLPFVIAHDPAQRVQQLYQVAGVPETFVIGRDGRLVWRVVGNIHAVLDSARAAIERAVSMPDVGGRSQPPPSQ